MVSVDSLKEAIERDDRTLDGAFLEDFGTARSDKPLQELLSLITQCPYPAPVVDGNDVYLGVVSKNTFLKTLEHGVSANQPEQPRG